MLMIYQLIMFFLKSRKILTVIFAFCWQISKGERGIYPHDENTSFIEWTGKCKRCKRINKRTKYEELWQKGIKNRVIQ
jgi:hypothetical protein